MYGASGSCASSGGAARRGRSRPRRSSRRRHVSHNRNTDLRDESSENAKRGRIARRCTRDRYESGQLLRQFFRSGVQITTSYSLGRPPAIRERRSTGISRSPQTMIPLARGVRGLVDSFAATTPPSAASMVSVRQVSSTSAPCARLTLKSPSPGAIDTRAVASCGGGSSAGLLEQDDRSSRSTKVTAAASRLFANESWRVMIVASVCRGSAGRLQRCRRSWDYA